MHEILQSKKDLIESYITKDSTVLDVGFWGQGVTHSDPDWPHKHILNTAKTVYGIDLDFDRSLFPDEVRYQKASAEAFDFGETKFDVIIAGDIIEHLSNPGLFLDCAARALKPSGVLVITTPNCFNLWNLIGKMRRYEPTVNSDHTCYFNEKTITRLFEKNGWKVDEILYLYTIGVRFKESWKKKIQNILYWILSRFTTKFMEPMVIVARLKNKYE